MRILRSRMFVMRDRPVTVNLVGNVDDAEHRIQLTYSSIPLSAEETAWALEALFRQFQHERKSAQEAGR